MYLAFGRESISWLASFDLHSSSVFEAVLIRWGWRMVGRETVSLERIKIWRNVVLGLLLLCVLVGGGLVGGVTYVAPLYDLEDNFSGFIQCFCNHLSDDCHLS